MKIQSIILFVILGILQLFFSCKTEPGVMTEWIPLKIDGTYQYINHKGEIVLRTNFAEAGFFSNGRALVGEKQKDGKILYGFIDTEGDAVILPQYKDATCFSEGIAFVVREEHTPVAIDVDGNILFTLPQVDEVRQYTEGMAAFASYNELGEKRWGFMDKDGKTVIAPLYMDAIPFYNGRAVVKEQDNEYGVIDKQGNYIVNPYLNWAVVSQNGNNYVLGSGIGESLVFDLEGNEILSTKLRAVAADGDLLAFYNPDSQKKGWCNLKGEIVIPAIYDITDMSANRFRGGEIVPVRCRDSIKVIDTKGKTVFYDKNIVAITPFLGEIALALTGDNKRGIIDKTGNWIADVGFEDVSPCFNILWSGEYYSIRSDTLNPEFSDYIGYDLSVNAFEQSDQYDIDDYAWMEGIKAYLPYYENITQKSYDSRNRMSFILGAQFMDWTKNSVLSFYLEKCGVDKNIFNYHKVIEGLIRGYNEGHRIRSKENLVKSEQMLNELINKYKLK